MVTIVVALNIPEGHMQNKPLSISYTCGLVKIAKERKCSPFKAFTAYEKKTREMRRIRADRP